MQPRTLLDFVDDDVPYILAHKGTEARILCLPYCMETNDFSLVLTRHLDPRKYAMVIEDHVTQGTILIETILALRITSVLTIP